MRLAIAALILSCGCGAYDLLGPPGRVAGSPDGAESDAGGDDRPDAGADAGSDPRSDAGSEDHFDAGTDAGGDSGTPTSIDECLTNNGGCALNATCTSVPGSLRACECKVGFAGTGVTCTPAPAPVSWWRFEETSGTVSDSAGSNHGTIVGSVSQGEPGARGRAVMLGGGHVLVPDSPSIQLVTYSVMAWVKTSDATDPYRWVLGKNATPAGYADQISLSIWSGKVRARVGTCNSAQPPDAGTIDGTRAVNDGAWHHLAIVVVQGTAMSVYVDGRLDVSTTLLTGAPCLNAAPLGVGTWTGAPTIPSIEAAIDEVKLFQTALTQAEVCQAAGGEPVGDGCTFPVP